MGARKISIRIPEKQYELIQKLVDHGFYANITDFIVRAIEDRLEKHGFRLEEVKS